MNAQGPTPLDITQLELLLLGLREGEAPPCDLPEIALLLDELRGEDAR